MKNHSLLARLGIIFILCLNLLAGYTKSIHLPVYADTSWNESDLSKQVEGFKAYCKSRNLTIDGSVADAVTAFTTQTYQNICNTLGINIDTLQSEIKYRTDSNIGLQWLFTSSGLSAYNRIFAEFLQNNNMQEGYRADVQLYDGYLFNGSLVYIVGSIRSTGDNGDNVYQIGTYYKYTGKSIYESFNWPNTVGGNTNYGTSSFPIFDNYSMTIYFIGTNLVSNNGNTKIASRMGNNTYGFIYGEYVMGDPCILLYNSSLYFGNFSKNTSKNVYYWECAHKLSQSEGASDYVSANVSVTTNNNIINQPTTINEGDTIIYNNDGSVYEEEDDDETIYNPYPDGGGTTTGGTNTGGDGGTINFPNFDFQLPEINWSLGDLSAKFPFSIPFDLIAFLTLLNGEPTAPHITGSIPLTSHYTWELDLDFSQFDTFASIMRGLEFVGFMFFLITATLNIARG